MEGYGRLQKVTEAWQPAQSKHRGTSLSCLRGEGRGEGFFLFVPFCAFSCLFVACLFVARAGRAWWLCRDALHCLAFSPDGATLATGSMDGTIRLWETSAGKEIARLTGHMQEATDVAFSPDGLTLASLRHHDSVKHWHLPTQRELVSLSLPQAGMFLTFSPDGRRLAVATDNALRFLEAPVP